MPTKNELEKELAETKALLFVAVRNMAVLPRGLLLGKTEAEISAKTFETIEVMKKKFNYKAVKTLMDLGANNGTNAGNQ